MSDEIADHVEDATEIMRSLSARVAELEAENKRLRKALTTLTDFVQTRVLDSGPDCDCDAAGHVCGWPAWQREVRFARAALEGQL